MNHPRLVVSCSIVLIWLGVLQTCRVHAQDQAAVPQLDPCDVCHSSPESADECAACSASASECTPDDCPNAAPRGEQGPSPEGGGCGTCLTLPTLLLCNACSFDLNSGELELEIDGPARMYMSTLMLLRTGEAGTIADTLWSGSPFGIDPKTFRSTRAPAKLELQVAPAPGYSESAMLVYRVYRDSNPKAKTMWISQAVSVSP